MFEWGFGLLTICIIVGYPLPYLGTIYVFKNQYAVCR